MAAVSSGTNRFWRRRDVYIAGASATAGVLVGVWAAETSRFVDWLLDTEWDWSSLPAEFFGAGLATFAGILISVRMTERSSARIRERIEDQTSREEVARQAAWRELYLAVAPAQLSAVPRSLASRLQTEVFEQAQGGDSGYASIVARHQTVEREWWRSLLPQVVERMWALVYEHSVHGLRQPAKVIELLAKAVEDDRLWIDPNIDAGDFLELFQAKQMPIGEKIHSAAQPALQSLTELADRHRVQPVGRVVDASGHQVVGAQYIVDAGLLLAPVERLGDVLRVAGYETAEEGAGRRRQIGSVPSVPGSCDG